MAIEVDGGIHNDLHVTAYDKIRTIDLNENGITVLRFSNDEIENNLNEVLRKIKDWFEENDIAELEPYADEREVQTLKMDKNSNKFVGSKAPLSSGRGAGGEVTNRLSILFAQKKTGVLNIYCTAGYPQLDSTLEVMKALQRYGADIIELGMPYSDPLADGPVIQQSSQTALKNGMTIAVLFDQLKDLRTEIQIPVILMGYMNPVLQYGIEKFCAAAATIGIDGIILPDLPMHEFETSYKAVFEKYRLHFIFLVTPETGEERIRKLDSLGSGFIYAVSSSSTTGLNREINDQIPYFKKLQAMQLKNPVLVGFGIRDKPTFEAATRYSSGAIIGSAYIRALQEASGIDQITKEFLNGILG